MRPSSTTGQPEQTQDTDMVVTDKRELRLAPAHYRRQQRATTEKR
jgi:hypothetical protein